MGDRPVRATQRFTCNQEFGSLGAFLREYVTNLSSGGVFIRSDEPLPIGTFVRLEFNVITEEGFETLRGVGEVVRTSEAPLGMGVAFTELEPESQALLSRLLAERAREPQGDA